MSIMLDLEAVDGMEDSTIESLIASMDKETLMMHINRWTKYRSENHQVAATLKQNRAAIMMTRRLRAMKEQKNRATNAAKKAAEPMSDADLGSF